MTVDPALWEAFHEAKNALFLAIQVSIPHAPNTLLKPRANRAASRAVIASAIASIEESCEAVESAEEELSRLGVHLRATITRARYSLAPIGALPIEILQEVFLYAATPRDQEMVLTVASVSQVWREAALHQRTLFTCPKWNKWPIELLKLWCSRAQGSLLDVVLEDADIITIHDNRDPWRVRLLQSTKPTWGSLSFQSGWTRNRDMDRKFIVAAKWLFKDTLPALRKLFLWLQHSLAWIEDIVVPITAPNLHDIRYSGVLLVPQKPLISLSELCIMKGNRRTFWMDMLRHTPALRALAIGSDHEGHHLDDRPHLELPSLIQLAYCGAYDEPHLERALRRMSCPNALAVNATCQPPTESLFQAIVSLCLLYNDRLLMLIQAQCMPRTLVLRFNEMHGLADVATVIRILSTQATLVPLLVGLDLSGNILKYIGEGSGDDAIRSNEEFVQYEAGVLRMSQQRKLLYLKLPLLSRSCASQTREYVKTLEASLFHAQCSCPTIVLICPAGRDVV